jgi:signal transduction histidine kinase
MTPFFLRLCLLFVVLMPMMFSAQATTLEAHTFSLNKIADVAVLEDPEGTLSIEDARSPAMADRFKVWPYERGQINLGFSSSTYWIRIPLQRHAQAPESWVIEVPYFQLHTLDFFAPNKDGVQTGGSQPITSRPFLHRFFAFPIAPSTEKEMFYMRVTSQHSLTVPITLWQEQTFRHHIQNTFILQSLYFGGLLALLIYNLFLAISLKDMRFLLYTLFVANFGLAMLAGNGFGQMFIWPGLGQFDGIAQSFFVCLSGCFSMLFVSRFLSAKRYVPKLSWCLEIFAAIYFVDAIAQITAPWHGLPLQWVLQLLYLITLPAGALVLIAGIKVQKHGQKRMRFFLLAWLVLWSGAIIATLRAFELIPTNTFTSYSLQISSALEMLLLAFALADMVHLERQERAQAQREALEANELLLKISRSTEDRLELEVQKRTLELKLALNTETQLLETYMRFGALISHEFRNPLGIVDSQISLLRKEHELGQLHLDKRLNIMSSATQRLLSLFNTWLNGDRLKHAMQEMKPQHIPLAAWLRELIDSQSSYHDSHPLTLTISRAVGDVWADEDLLEVVMLNLIDNACKYSPAGLEVAIETRQKPGWIGIAVIDQGCGIDSKDHQAVFDDYRRVSSESTISGLGLGLAFVRRIVNMHQGELELKSAIGKGSTFCVWLPLK